MQGTTGIKRVSSSRGEILQFREGVSPTGTQSSGLRRPLLKGELPAGKPPNGELSPTAGFLSFAED